MTEGLRLSVLGGLEVRRDGAPVHGFVSAKAPALLAYLAVTGRPHFRAALAGLLWGDSAEAQALGSLRKVLSNLRKLVGEHLLVTAQTVALDPKLALWLDVAEFEAAGKSSDVAGLERAVELYRGDFLAGFYVRDAPEFEEWAVAQRERFRQMALRALGRLLEQAAGQGAYVAAAGYAGQVLALAPWDEETHRRLMWLLARSGQRTAALAQYEICRRALDRELGVEPAEETQALQRRIRAAGSARPHNLPAPSTSFAGRTAELATIARLLVDDGCRLLTLLGPGGIGKTRLAVEAALSIVEDATGVFPDGVYIVSPTEPRPAELLAADIAEEIGCRGEASSDPRRQLSQALRAKELLLVLDGFEVALETAPFVAELLAACPRLKVLVTSREPLNLNAEHRLSVPPLPMPDLERLPPAAELLEYPALKLFAERARQVQDGFTLDEGNGGAVARLCARLDGLPLAIELAAARAGEMAPQAMLERLAGGLELLAGNARDLPARQRTLAAAIDWSYDLLPAAEQAVFAGLAVFRGGCSAQAAAAVVALPDVERSLQRLADKSLLYRKPAAEGVRFWMLDTIQEYASERLSASKPGQGEALQRRHAAYYLAFAEEAGLQLRGAEQAAWLEQVDREHPNLRAALCWAADSQDAELALRLCGALGMFWYSRSHLSEARHWLALALALPAARPTAAAGEAAPSARQAGPENTWRAEALRWLGTVATLLGEYDACAGWVEEAIALRRAAGDEAGIVSLLSWLGWVNYNQGNLERARAYYEGTLAAARERGTTEHPSVAFVLNCLGNLARDGGDLTGARAHYEASAATWRALQRQDGVVCALNNLGYVVHYLGDDVQARSLLAQVLALASELGDRRHVAYALEGMAAVAGTAGEAVRAARLFGQAESIREAIQSVLSAGDQAEHERNVALARAGVDAAAFEAAWAEGRAMAPGEAVAYATAAGG